MGRDRRAESVALGIEQTAVRVHHAAGCAICTSTEPHTHIQDDWRAELDRRDPAGGA